MAPVVAALAERRSGEPHVILTGQHDRLAEHFSFLPPRSIHHLGYDATEQSAGEISEGIEAALCRRLAPMRPDLVLVQGDTSSALAGARAARICGLPLAHVEAGLRSFDRANPWPEEDNRIAIDAIADLLFAPTETAARHLAAEGLAGAVHITGNSGIDALFHARRRLNVVHQPDPLKPILVTCHRRENRGPGLQRIATALKRLVREFPCEILFPLHPNHHVREAVAPLLAGEPRIHLLDPVDHPAIVALLDRAWLILTDSGGLQEEGAALGRPVLVLRDVTERTEAPANIELVGTDPDRIVEAVRNLLHDEARYARMSRPSLAFGDGHASERIADVIEQWLVEREKA